MAPRFGSRVAARVGAARRPADARPARRVLVPRCADRRSAADARGGALGAGAGRGGSLPARFSGALLEAGGVALHASGAAGGVLRARVLVNAAGPWASGVMGASSRASPCRRSNSCRARTSSCAAASPRASITSRVRVTAARCSSCPGTEHAGRHHGERASAAIRRGAAAAAPRSLLIGMLRHYFPRHASLQARELLGRFAGLRVLPAGGGHAFHRSRETLLLPDRRSGRACSGSTAASSPDTARRLSTSWNASAVRCLRRARGRTRARSDCRPRECRRPWRRRG